MASAKRNNANGVAKLEAVLRDHFADAQAYRYNSASIRVRVVDAAFADKSRSEREEMVWPLLSELPESIRADVTMLVLVTPDEKRGSLLNLEFENPSKSLL